jgi:integrase
MEILEWHVAQLATGFRSESLPLPEKVSLRAQRMVESDLLFPSWTGGFRTDTVLQKPFADVIAAMKLKKHLSPRAMRRTFQDLARGAAVEGLVQRSICGHATGEMTERYSSVAQDEIKAAVGKVISLARFRESVGAVGVQLGVHGRKTGERGELAASNLAK